MTSCAGVCERVECRAFHNGVQTYVKFVFSDTVEEKDLLTGAPTLTEPMGEGSELMDKFHVVDVNGCNIHLRRTLENVAASTKDASAILVSCEEC